MADRSRLPCSTSNFFTRVRNTKAHYFSKLFLLQRALSQISVVAVRDKWAKYLAEVPTFVDFVLLLWRAHPLLMRNIKKWTLRLQTFSEFIFSNPQQPAMMVSRDPDFLLSIDRNTVAKLRSSMSFELDKYPLNISNEDIDYLAKISDTIERGE